MTFITPGQLTQRRSEVFIKKKKKLSSVQLVGIKARIRSVEFFYHIKTREFSRCDEVAIEICLRH